MIFGFLIAFLRHLKKHANIAVINILSYGVGIGACLILAQYVYYETSYDRFYKDHQSVYRISLDNYYGNVYQSSTAFTFLPLAPELKNEYSEVEEFTIVQDRQEVVTVKENSFFEKHILVADTNYYKVFSLDMLEGSSKNVSPNDIFISETIAIKYFGVSDPIGKTMKVFRDHYTIRGVFKDLPRTTHLKFDILCLVAVRESTDWNVPFMFSYIKLNGNAEGFIQKLKTFSEKFSKLANEQHEAEYSFNAKLQPLASIHLQSALLDELELNGRLDDIYILAAIGGMILIITCFNYINLTNAINSARSKEIFVRKIQGESYRNSITQRIVESLALNIVGFAIAFIFLITFVQWIGPYYNFPFLVIDWTSNMHYFTLLTIFISVLIISGIVPAILSSPARLPQFLNRTSSTQKVNSGFARNIAFVQFAISGILISGALVVLKQTNFMREGNQGFSDENVMALEINALSYRANEDQFMKVKSDLERIATIENVSFSSCLPGEKLINTSVRLSSEPAEETKNCDVQVITSDYFDVYEMEISEGRIFDEGNPADVLKVVVNESLAKELTKGNGENIINRVVTVDWGREPVDFTVVGVVEDYYHYSKKQVIQPMIFLQLKNTFSVFRISVKNSDKANWKSNEQLSRKALTDHLTEPYSKRGIQVAFDVVDVESAYNKQYGDNEMFSKFLNALALLAISMAGIGFFSLASSTTRKRIKEVAIRKVYGAQVVDMLVLLSTYFLKLAGAALVISLPISYFLTQDWLNQFATKIDVGVWFVLWPLLLTIGLTFLSIGYFVLRLIFIKPVHHLRIE